MSVSRREVGMSRLMSVVLLLAAPSAFALAQEAAHLDVKTVVQKEEVYVNDDGETETRLVEASSVIPGERVVYTITFRNISDEIADNVVITNPIDSNLTYVDGSAFGPGTIIEFSVDGGNTWGSPDVLTVVEDGVARPAEANDFTHVRWVMQNDLAAGAQGIARFTAVLD